MSTLDVSLGDSLRSGERGTAHDRAPSAARVLALLRAGVGTIDAAIVLSAFGVAYLLRFVAPGNDLVYDEPRHFATFAALVAAFAVVLLGARGHLDVERPRAWPSHTYAVASAVSMGVVLALTASYVLGEPLLSRVWSTAGWLLSIVGLVAWRTLAPRAYVAALDAVGHAPRVLIVGTNYVAREVARELAQRGVVIGFVDNGVDGDAPLDLPLIGPITDLAAIVMAHGIDELVIALPPNRREQVSRVIARGFRRPIRVRALPDVADEPPRTLAWSDLLPQRLEVGRLGTRAYISFSPAADVTWTKRLIDLVLGAMITLMLAPLLAAVALVIRLDSAGPIFYRQERVGLHGRRFRMFKFRSMSADADARQATLQHRNEAAGPMFKIRDDPRVTRVGRLLRRFSIDELPQLINVLRGEMSLVGPRPPLPSELREYEDWQLGRLRAIPGMTGLWQVSGRSEVPFRDMVRLDLHYVRNWSLALDLEILIRTIPAVIARRGAY